MLIQSEEQVAAYVRGLLEEKRQYLQVGDTERAAAVDAELARLQVQAKPPRKRAQTR